MTMTTGTTKETTAPVPALLAVEAKTSTSTSSGNRRARGKKSSLKALLSGQQTKPLSTGKSSGLDLMDFMKT